MTEPLNTWTLKGLAEMGYSCGLSTIGEVAGMAVSHHHAFFITANLTAELEAFYKVVEGHQNDPIDQYLTPEDKKRLDDELEAVLHAKDAQNTGEKTLG